jgi:hypothetical protein
MEMQNQDVGGVRPGAIAAGAILLALGTAMLLGTMGALAIHPGRLIGPLILITIGASMVLDRNAFICGRLASTVDGDKAFRRRRGRSLSGVWLLGVGVWLLVAQNDLLGLNFHNSWPLLLVLGGIISVIRGFK